MIPVRRDPGPAFRLHLSAGRLFRSIHFPPDFIMPTLTIYEKPTCSTCRDVMKRLNEAGVAYDAINYITDPLSRAKLVELIAKMGIAPRELLRPREPEYRELELGDPSISDDRIIDAMAEHPGLIQRPILEYGEKAALGRPADRVTEALRAWGIAERGS